MKPGIGTISNLLGLLYEAAASAHEEAWIAFLEAVRGVTKSDKAYFVLIDPKQQCNFSLQLGFDPAWQRAYAEHYHKHDLLYKGLVSAKRLHGEWAGTASSVISDLEFKDSLIYNEFVLPQARQNWSWCGVAMNELEGGLDGGLGIQRTTVDEPFDREQIALLRILSPHLHRAMNTFRTLSDLRGHQQALHKSLEILEVALVAFDCKGRILHCTPAARAVLDARNGLEVVGGFLRTSVLEEQSRLDGIIMGAVATGSGQGTEAAIPLGTNTSPELGNVPLWTPAAGGSILVSRRPPKRPLRLVVTPVRTGEVLSGGSPAALAFINDPDTKPASRATVLRALYGLTPTECRIADLIVRGHEVSDIADLRGMTVGTARFHLKSIFRKTGVSRQVQLVQLLHGLPGDALSQL